MRGEKGYQSKAAPRARYVFAGTGGQDEDMGTKTCPRCGQVLFDDMDVCFGCLYDFSRDRGSVSRTSYAQERRTASNDPEQRAPEGVPLDNIELDEIDDDEPADDVVQQPIMGIPRHSKLRASSPEDTLDLGPASLAVGPKSIDAGPSPLVTLSSSGLSVSLVVPHEGLMIGRDEGCDIVVRSPVVSRHHMRIFCEGSKVMAEDCGATNPAIFDGMPLRQKRSLGQGSEVTIGDVVFSLASREAGQK